MVPSKLKEQSHTEKDLAQVMVFGGAVWWVTLTGTLPTVLRCPDWQVSLTVTWPA